MIFTIDGIYNTETKEIETIAGLKLGGLYVPNEDVIASPNEFALHKLEIKVSKKGNLVAILKK